MIEDAKKVLRKLGNKTPFAFNRFNDGEMLAIRTPGSIISRGAQVVEDSLHDKMKEALCHKQKNYFRGLPCPECYPELAELAQQHVGGEDEHTVLAVSLINRNFGIVGSILPELLEGRTVWWVCGKDQNIEKLPFKVDKHIATNVTDSWANYESIKDAILEAPEGTVVLLSCGPLGRVLCKEWFEKREDCSFIEIGSFYDPLTRNVIHNYHHQTLPGCGVCN